MGDFIYIERHDLMLILVPGRINKHEDVANAEKEISKLTGINTVILSGSSFTAVSEQGQNNA